MEIILNNLVNDTTVSNTNLKNAYDLTSKQIIFKQESNLNDLKKFIDVAIKNKKDVTKLNENKKRRYKLMQKYGDVLNKVFKLLNIMPTNFDDLSMTEINKNLEELNLSRKKNYNIMRFDHYQNLFAEITNRLLKIEKDFQNGVISSKDAREQVIALEEKMDTVYMPSVLKKSKEELDYLISCYKQEFQSASHIESLNLTFSTSKKMETFNLKQKFQTLNNRTNELTSKIVNLHTDISEFNPNVDLSPLFKMLTSTNEAVLKEDWKYPDVNSQVNDLNRLTDKLTSEQLNKNNKHEELADRVKELNKETIETKTECSFEIIQTMHKNANIRSKQSIEILEDVEEQNNVSENFTNIAEQYANVVNEQANVDNETCLRVTQEKNAKTLFNTELSTEAIEKSEELTEQLQVQQQDVLTVKPEDDEDSTPPVV